VIFFNTYEWNLFILIYTIYTYLPFSELNYIINLAAANAQIMPADILNFKKSINDTTLTANDFQVFYIKNIIVNLIAIILIQMIIFHCLIQICQVNSPKKH